MDPTASLSILPLLVCICSAFPVMQPDYSNGFILIPGNMDITTKILETNKGSSEYLIEGDVALPLTRSAYICPHDNCFWKKNSNNTVEVPYTISSDFSSSDVSVIENAMSTFHNKTCIRFVPRINQTDYLSIESKTGCFSFIGKTGGKQVVSFKSTTCVYHGIIQHELNHALGFYHEHTRSDRDQYIRINWENIKPDVAYNFEKKNTNNQNITYDYGSVMHYGRMAFSVKPGLETITPIPDATVQIGQRQELSSIDILKINTLYKCTV